MLRSMTGFGRAEKEIDGFEIKAQIKSVNHRYSDFTIKVPRYYLFLEDSLRKIASNYISRGKVEILITINQKDSDDREITLNKPIAENYFNVLSELKELGAEGSVSVDTLARFSDIFQIEYKEIDEEQILHMVTEVLTEALEDFVNMRTAEGAQLEESLNAHLDALIAQVEAVEERSPVCVQEYHDKLLKRITEVLENTSIDESRIVTEAAIFADKVSVDEETVRLRSHVKSFKAATQLDTPSGKKLDFIVQEMNREANTIGSKANDITIANHVVELKSIIEKIREQIQNIE